MSDAATVNDGLESATEDEEAQELLANAVDDGAGADQPDESEKDWQAEFKAQQRINRDLERRSKSRMRELERELAEARKPKPDAGDKPDLEAIRSQIKAETQAEALKERAMDKLEAKAARLFQNPEDARAFLASRVDEFIDDGKVDVEAITDALDGLLTERPYLGVTQGEPKRFKGTGDGGPRGSAGKPQLSRQDVERLAAEGKHEEIEAARVGGQLNNLLGIT